MKLERRHRRKTWKWDVVNNARNVFVSDLRTRARLMPSNPFATACQENFPNLFGASYTGNYEKDVCVALSNISPIQYWNYDVKATSLRIDVPAHLPQGSYTVNLADWYYWQ